MNVSKRSSTRLAFALLAAAFVSSAASPSTTRVKEVRFWSLGEVTRVAIEVSGDFKYRHDRLSVPDRIFFDLEGARPQMTDRKVIVIPVGDSLLKQIRVAETVPGVTRVVLDLVEHDPPVEFTASQLAAPERLIIELRLKDSPPPAAVPGVSGSATPTGSGTEAKPAARKFEPPRADPATTLDRKPPVLAPPAAAAVAAPARAPLSGGALRLSLPPFPAAAADAKPAAPKPAPPSQALPAKPNADGEESLTRVLGLKLGRVVIDPGHGGHDEGTRGPTGLTEKEVVLDIAKRLGALLEQRLGTEVVYTREDDTFIPLEERTRIANERRADLFLSIHANSSPLRSVSGVESYYLNFTTSKTALDVAARENATAQSSIFDLQQVLQKIAVKDKIDESREFATRVQSALFAISAKANPAAKNRGVKKAPFVVLIGASMPSVLAEIGFLTNLNDEGLLRNPAHRQKVAEALYKGIASYANTLSHFSVAQRE
jgi:N-acetylmuramoyl-L-alanine amidase